VGEHINGVQKIALSIKNEIPRGPRPSYFDVSSQMQQIWNGILLWSL